MEQKELIPKEADNFFPTDETPPTHNNRSRGAGGVW